MELTPQELFSRGLHSSALNDHPWLVRWDGHRSRVAADLAALLPPEVEFQTSGSTGTPSHWRRTREQLWTEAGLLADLLRGHAPEAVVSFAPPRHLYGTLVTALVPAHLGLPAWYNSRFARLPDTEGNRRWAVMAIPWAFEILRQRPGWLPDVDSVVFLHSTAALPSAAATLLSEIGGGDIVEIFGSTESGGVATRTWNPHDPPWTLLEDVTLADAPPEPSSGTEVPLAVRSPRLAAPRDGAAPEVCRLDDYVQPLGERRFAFAGRRDRIVNVNGRRIVLDTLESRLRELVDCIDLACVPVFDESVGEQVEVLLVPSEATTSAAVHEAFGQVGIRPRHIRTLERIDRSETGKLRRLGAAHTPDTEAEVRP